MLADIVAEIAAAAAVDVAAADVAEAVAEDVVVDSVGCYFVIADCSESLAVAAAAAAVAALESGLKLETV